MAVNLFLWGDRGLVKHHLSIARKPVFKNSKPSITVVDFLFKVIFHKNTLPWHVAILP